jgi:alkanesulfonate monooxygenase SsuD/methylene tetrahydromethanopterin reductase-like flavin-dependent oxidoreductase (luciferase family)
MHVGLGAFFQSLDGRSDTDAYRHELAIVDEAEGRGFDSIWTPEHHFTEYTMSPNPAQFLSWVAGRTSRVQLGSMVTVLPWHDPVRVAEDWSLLDQLSGGRSVLGIGRGLGRVEFEGFRLPMGESRRRFVEYAEAVSRGLEKGHIAYEGELYRQPRVDVRPASTGTWQGRVYASSVSPASAEIIARLGIGIMVIAQKPWETTVAELDHYRDLFREFHGREAPAPILMQFVAVHESEAGAAEMWEEYTVGYSRSALAHYEFDNEGLAEIEGYEYYGKLAENIAKHGTERFCRFLAELQPSGTPARVTEQLVANTARIGAESVIAIVSFGGMPMAQARENFRLLAEEVRPALQSRSPGSRWIGGVL